MNPRTTRILLVLGAFVAGLVFFSTVVFIVTGRSPAPIAMPSAVGGPFALTDQNGKPITDKDMAGHPFLVFFGFTHCPDVCPTTLFDVSEIFRALGPDKEVRALFVTVDPERDTTAAMKDYLSSFDPRLKGLTGNPEQIANVLKEYRVYARKVPLKDGDYTMDHTALIYLMDRDGKFVSPFNLNRKPEEAAAYLKHYL